MKVTFSDPMKAQLPEFSDEIRQAVLNFVTHVKEHGLRGLQGRNKSSVPDNVHTKKERVNYAYAQKHCLWHYHIGIPCYIGEDGNRTSEYILHYQRFDDGIVIMDMTAYPPFALLNIDKRDINFSNNMFNYGLKL